MKRYSLVILLMAVMLYTGCTDHLAGPALDTQDEGTALGEESVGKRTLGRLADLSLNMRASTITPTYCDSLLYYVDIHNAGPDKSTGVAVSVDLPFDTLYSLTSASATRGHYNDSLGVWIVGYLPSGATEQLVLKGLVVGTGTGISTAEISASDVRDPDSKPGDGDPRQDDYDSVRISVRRGALR